MDADQLLSAVQALGVEALRPLHPVGYAATAAAYQAAAATLGARDLSEHYRDGVEELHEVFVPWLKGLLGELTGGAWDLSDFVGFAAGSDVDLMTHLVEAVAPREGAAIYPGDWWGFQVGGTQDAGVRWSEDARGGLACLCLPSVRNGVVTEEMARFLESGEAALLNINLFPTLPAQERARVAARLAPVLERAVISVSFSRGFGMTASQLGVALVHRDHPYRARFARQWGWSSFFYNALAARAMMALDLEALRAVDARRRAWVEGWLRQQGLPVVSEGSYYVKSFRVQGALPEALRPLWRGDVARLCFKPPLV